MAAGWCWDQGPALPQHPFHKLAVEFGNAVERDPSIGWSVTNAPDVAAADYAMQVTVLEFALIAYRLADPYLAGRNGSNNGLVAECGCQPARKIRLSRTAYRRRGRHLERGRRSEAMDEPVCTLGRDAAEGNLTDLPNGESAG